MGNGERHKAQGTNTGHKASGVGEGASGERALPPIDGQDTGGTG